MYLGMKKGRYSSFKDRCKYLVVSLVSLCQEIVTLVTLGFVTPEWRAMLLFSEWSGE